jgi:RNA polymerase sigma-70 factor (ECF subfamily)
LNRPDANRTTEDLRQHLDARFRKPLMSFFLRRTRSRSDAEDLTQEVFARILGTEARLPLDRADGLVFTVAANLLRDRHRRAQVRHQSDHCPIDLASAAELANSAVEVRDPERVLLAKRSLDAALDLLDELGQRTKDIFMLVRLENMRHHEVAALFGVSVSTVEKHVIRATVHLALHLGEDLL